MSEEKVLTKEISEQFLANEESVDLTKFKKIEDEACLILSKYEYSLDLSGLIEISDISAHLLSSHEGGLDLSGLSKLSDTAAESLAKHVAESMGPQELKLNGLTKLNDIAAKSLSMHRGLIELHGLKELSTSAIEFFAMMWRNENYRSQIRLSPQLSKKVNKYKILTKEIAQEFRGYDDLPWHECTEIEDDAAKVISQYDGGSVGHWNLSGLTQISDKTAKYFSKLEANLSLNGLTKISDTQAEILCKRKDLRRRWFLELNGLIEISDRVAEYFITYESLNYLGLKSISDKTAQILSKVDWALNLSGLTELSDSAAKHLSKHSGRFTSRTKLYLNGLSRLSDSAANNLSKYQGEIHLNGITKISASCAASLSKLKNNLSLNGLTTISSAISEGFTEHEHDLSLNGIIKVS